MTVSLGQERLSARADQVLARILPGSRTDKDKLIRFAAAYARGETRPTVLARETGMARETCKAYLERLEQVLEGAQNKAPSKMEQVNLIGGLLVEAAQGGDWKSVPQLSAELSRLTGRYEPERKESVVRHVITRTGGLDALDAEIASIDLELTKVGTVEDAQFAALPDPASKNHADTGEEKAQGPRTEGEDEAREK